MAFLFGDTCDHYSTLTEKWTQAGQSVGGTASIVAAEGRNGTSAIRLTPGGSGQRQSGPEIVLATTGSTFVANFSFRSTQAFNSFTLSTSETSSNGAFSVADTGGTQVWGRFNADATISVYRGTTLIGTSDPTGLQQNVVAYLEIKVVLHASTGSVTIKVNGTTVMALTNVNTSGASTTAWTTFRTPSIAGGTESSTFRWYIDDVMVMDGSGSAYNDFIGDHEGLYVPADGEGAHTDGTPSAGADRAAMVDEASADGDSTYNSKAASAERDSFTLSTWPASGVIGPIQVVAQVRKEDNGAANIALGVRISGTDHDGADQGMNTTYAIKREVFELNPGTTAAWAGGAAPELVDAKTL